MGGAVFPHCCLIWGQTMVEVIKIMTTSFKRSHAHTAALSAPTLHQASTDPRLNRRLLDTHRQVWVSLDSILKSRDITLPTKVHLVKAMVFPVVMYGYASWTIKKPALWRIDAFELWCWRRLLRVLWTTRRSNQSILKEINPEYPLEGLMLKLRLPYFGHLMQIANALEKTLCWERLKAKGEEGSKGWNNSIASLTQWTWIYANFQR